MPWITGNRILTIDEQKQNAFEIWAYFKNEGWSLNAVSGMLGNMQRESWINPGVWQGLTPYSGGYGLVQWTPYTKYSEWAGSNWENNGFKQCERIQYELENGLQWTIEDSNYNITFLQFSTSTASPEWLASAFLKNYEKAGVLAEEERKMNARFWYNFLERIDPPTPTPIPSMRRKMPILFYLKKLN